MGSKPETNFDMNHLTNCPVCEGELKTYVPSYGFILDYTYCPECDIAKNSFMSAPYLCEECHSELFYQLDGDDFCFMCNSDKMKAFSHEEFKEIEEQGTIKQGFRAFERFEMPEKEHCYNTLECMVDLLRVHHEVFESICAKCGESIYVKVPEISQLENNWMGERIPIEEYIGMLRANPIKVVPFSDEDDLLDKVRAELDEVEEDEG